MTRSEIRAAVEAVRQKPMQYCLPARIHPFALLLSPPDCHQQAVLVHDRSELLQRLFRGLLKFLRPGRVGGVVRDEVHQHVAPLKMMDTDS